VGRVVVFGGSLSSPIARCPCLSIKMTNFYPHDIIRILLYYFYRFFDIHLIEVMFGLFYLFKLLFGTVYPIGGNVQKGQDPGLGPVDYLFLEFWEIFPSRGSGIYHCGHPSLEAEVVRGYAVDTIGKFSGSRPHKDMGMNIDQARTYV